MIIINLATFSFFNIVFVPFIFRQTRSITGQANSLLG